MSVLISSLQSQLGLPVAQDKAILEAAQKKAVHKVSGLTSSNYDGRLKELNLLSLEERRESFDLVQTFKIVRKCDDVDPATRLQLAGDSPARITRHTNDPMKIVHPNPAPARDKEEHFQK